LESVIASLEVAWQTRAGLLRKCYLIKRVGTMTFFLPEVYMRKILHLFIPIFLFLNISPILASENQPVDWQAKWIWHEGDP